MPRAPRACVQPRPVSEAELRHAEPIISGKGIGWTVGCLSYVAVGMLLSTIDPTKAEETLSALPVALGSALLYGPLFGIPIVVGVIAARLRRAQKFLAWRERELLSRRQRAEEEAATTTRRVREIEAEAASVVNELPRLLAQVRAELDAADNEYAERAFGPFWDRIASSAQLLATYRVKLDRITSLGRKYSRLLGGREHSFPKRLSVPEVIPEPADLVARLARLAREGQKDFQFAVIWEQHKTRRVLVEGFSTLGSTLQELANTLQASLADCTAQVAGAISDATGALQSSTNRGAEEVGAELKEIKHILERKRD